MKKVTFNSKVQFHMTGRLDSGDVFDSTEDHDPLTVTIGSGLLIKSFEQALIGMEEGEKKSFIIKSQNAYGNSDKELILTVNKSDLPEDVGELETGEIVSIDNLYEVLEMKEKITDKGANEPYLVTVKAVHENEVELDFNHPLTGETLNFDVEIIEIQKEGIKK